MSSSTWTRDALSSESKSASGTCWRIVEAQHHVSTAKLTDTADEQERLEQLIEASKPRVPRECEGLHYLLFTPFRYGAPYPHGSRFRRAGMTPGVFYAAVAPETAATERAFYQLLFFAESPATPWPSNPGEFTCFAVSYSSRGAIDLTAPPFAAQRAAWTHKTDYRACQDLAEAMRAADLDLIKYESARDPQRGINIAILSCRAFAQREPGERQSWRIAVSGSGARLICEWPKRVISLDRAAFAGDPRIAAMRWER